MALLEKIRVVAEWLGGEARRRVHDSKRFEGAFDLVESSGQLALDFHMPFGETAKAGERGKTFCTVSTYPWQPCALLTFAGEKQTSGNTPAQEHQVRIIVYFGHQPELEVTGESETEKQGKRRLMRNLLWRARKGRNLSSHVMIIDELTSRREIEEQISIFLAQEEVWDDSTRRALGMQSSDPVKAEMGSHLIERFIDPPSPKSYPAYKKALRLRVVGPEEAPKKQAGIQITARRNAREHPTPKSDYAVREAAEIIDVPWRTLYRWVREMGLEVDHDRWGRIRIPSAELEKLRRRGEDRTNRKAALSLVAGRRDIKRASARKRIRRAEKSGKTLHAVVREAVEGSRPTSPQDHR